MSKLKQLREERGLPQKAVAKSNYVRYNKLADILRGKNNDDY